MISFRATFATKFLSYAHTQRLTRTHRLTDTQTDTHVHTDSVTHTQTDIFQEQTNRVQDIPKRVNPSKTGIRKFARNLYFLLVMQKKVIIRKVA